MATAIRPKTHYSPNTGKRSIVQSLAPALTSTVGTKYLVALTGLGLTGFVFGHLAGNLNIFLGPDALNAYAQKLKSLGPLLWVARLGLLVMFVLHLGLTLRLKWLNAAARPERYAYEQTIQATWASRHMLLTGLVVLAFLIFHLMHFTFAAVAADAVVDGASKNFLELHEHYRAYGEDHVRHDVHAMVVAGFRNVPVAVAYIIAQVFLGLHLSHGIGSIFQTLGLNHPSYARLIQRAGVTLAVVLAAGNIAIPVSVMMGWVK